MENQDTDDEGEIDPTPPIQHRREQAGFEDDQKKDLDSTDEAEEEDDFSHEENKQCDNYRPARQTQETDDHDKTVELDGSSDEEQHTQAVQKIKQRVERKGKDLVDKCMESFLADPHPFR